MEEGWHLCEEKREESEKQEMRGQDSDLK